MLESLVRRLLFYTMPYVTGHIGTVTSYPQQVLADLLPIVAVALQTRPERKRTYRKDV
jgi:hypothetical protein